MAHILKLLKLLSALVVCLSIVKGGLAACSLSDISVTQTAVGSVSGGTEFQVDIANGCICPQSKLLLNCPGFSSLEPVNSTLFRSAAGGTCLVNDGRPVQKGDNLTFKYAAAAQFPLTPTSSTIVCS